MPVGPRPPHSWRVPRAGEPKEPVRIVGCGLVDAPSGASADAAAAAADGAYRPCAIPHARRQKAAQQDASGKDKTMRRNKTMTYDTSTRSALFSWT